jgi:hypothetical protein
MRSLNKVHEKNAVRVRLSARPSVCPHDSTREPLVNIATMVAMVPFVTMVTLVTMSPMLTLADTPYGRQLPEWGEAPLI